jgi:hypothetical protein
MILTQYIFTFGGGKFLGQQSPDFRAKQARLRNTLCPRPAPSTIAKTCKIFYASLTPTLTLPLTPRARAPKITHFSQNPQISRRKRTLSQNDNARHSF